MVGTTEPHRGIIIRNRQADPTSDLILWQVGVTGNLSYQGEAPGIQLLTNKLSQIYGPTYEVVVYEAAQIATFLPRIERIPLQQLPQCQLSSRSTLYISTQTVPAWDMDMIQQLGLNQADLSR